MSVKCFPYNRTDLGGQKHDAWNEIQSYVEKETCIRSSMKEEEDEGSWMLDPGPWMQDPGSRTLDPGSRVLDPESLIQDPGTRILDPGAIVDAGGF